MGRFKGKVAYGLSLDLSLGPNNTTSNWKLFAIGDSSSVMY